MATDWFFGLPMSLRTLNEIFFAVVDRNDRVEFGLRDVAYVLFNPHHAGSNTAREFLSQISGIQLSTDSTDLEKLTLFL